MKKVKQFPIGILENSEKDKEKKLKLVGIQVLEKTLSLFWCFVLNSMIDFWFCVSWDHILYA